MCTPGLDGEPLGRILKKAKEDYGMITSIDTAWNDAGSMNTVRPGLPYLDFFISSIAEARLVTGKEDLRELADVLLDHGVRVVVVKMGPGGCYIKTRQDGGYEVRIPAWDVPVVDTTGAGDSFVAGFLTGVMKGWDLERAGRFGNTVGATAVGVLGAVEGVRSFEETLELMQVLMRDGRERE
ncbi:MAG TPA: hypothetical protein GXX51_06520 [Firmicutes bacterium]|nr:hypothetical protein [Bacillota bacterium]